MKQTWHELREALKNDAFKYSDTDTALSFTFLKQFDQWFHGIGEAEMTVSLHSVFQKNIVGRVPN